MCGKLYNERVNARLRQRSREYWRAQPGYQYRRFIAAQKAEEGGRWRQARDLYREAGASKNAQQMTALYRQELEDKLVISMMGNNHYTPRRRWTDGLA